tara:strand:+ start:12199 stop:12399 length:201 start_codon:yes stop_codon:yes gene_type:complete
MAKYRKQVPFAENKNLSSGTEVFAPMAKEVPAFSKMLKSRDGRELLVLNGIVFDDSMAKGGGVDAG